MRWDAAGQKNVCANRAPFTNYGVPAHDGCTRIESYFILNRGMPLQPAQLLAFRERFGDQTNALIHFDVVANNAGLANDCSRAMVHKEMRSDPSARVQIHARTGVRPFRHDAWDEGDIFQIKLMGEPLHRNGFDARVSHDDFFLLSAAGSPLNAASVSVCSNSRRRGRLARNSSV